MWNERGAGFGDGPADGVGGAPAAAEAADGDGRPLFVARDKLRMRSGASLSSEAIGSLESGSIVRVLEQATLADGVRRARTADEESGAPLGWVSVYARDGFENLRALSAAQRDMVEAIAHHNAALHRRATIVETLMKLDGSGGSGGSGERGGDGGGGAMVANGEHEAWIGAVRRCVLLSQLSPGELNFVRQSARLMRTSPGEVIYSQRDSIVTGMLYLVASGSYRATVELEVRDGSFSTSGKAHSVRRRTRDYGPFDNFGGHEVLCLDTNGERMTSVTVREGGLVWGIPRRIIDQKLRIPPPPTVPDVTAFCRGVKLFASVTAERMQQLCRGAVQVELSGGEQVLRAGDMARSIFAIRRGSVRINLPNSTDT